MNLTSKIEPGMIGAFYARHSTAKQNIDTQIALAEQLVEELGCTLLKKRYLDEAVSARKKTLNERTSLKQLLDDIFEKKFHFIIVYQQDRLARDPSEHLFIRSLLNQHNIPVIIASTRTFYDSGDIITNVFKDGLSQYEVETLRKRTKDTITGLHKRGYWTGGVAPFGYTYDPITKLLINNEIELNIVRDIYKLHNQQIGLQTIANILNKEYELDEERICNWDKSTKVKSKKSKKFKQIMFEEPSIYLNKETKYRTSKTKLNKQLIKRILTNPIYSGHLVQDRKKDLKDWDFVKTTKIVDVPLFTKDEWKQSYAKYEQRYKESNNYGTFQTSFPLAKIIYCGKCNSVVTTKNQQYRVKDDIEPHGETWYMCREALCNYKVMTSDVHMKCIQILKMFILERKEQFSVLIKDKHNHLVDQLEEKIRSQKHLIKQLENKIELSKQKKTDLLGGYNLDPPILSDNPKDNHEIINVLDDYTFDLELQLSTANRLLSQLERKLSILMQEDVFTEILYQIDDVNKHSELNNILLQRSLTQLIDQIIVFPEELTIIANRRNKIAIAKKIELMIKVHNQIIEL